MLSAIKQLVRIERDYVPYANESEQTSLYIRPTLFGTEPTLGVGVSSKALCIILLSPVGAYFPTGLKPVTLLATTKYVRAAKGGTGNSKMGSNYSPTIYVQKVAERSNCQQVLWLHTEVTDTGKKELHLTEVGTMNCFVYLKNKNGGKFFPPCFQLSFVNTLTSVSIFQLRSLSFNESLNEQHEISVIIPRISFILKK